MAHKRRVVLDAEFDSLQPTKVWAIVCKDIDNDDTFTFRNDTDNFIESFASFARTVSLWVGHNVIAFDSHHIARLLGVSIDWKKCIDTLIVSRLINYHKPGGHSVENWSKQFGLHKKEIPVYDDPNLIDDYVERCKSDVEIQYRIYKELERFIKDPSWRRALRAEHDVQYICRDMHVNGFAFNKEEADRLLSVINDEMAEIEDQIKQDVPPVLVKGTPVKLRINKNGRPSQKTVDVLSTEDWHGSVSITDGGDYHRFSYQSFNPGSSKQRIDYLNSIGWQPVDKTKGHIQCERDLKHARSEDERKKLEQRLENFRRYGWRCNETNLETLPRTDKIEEWVNNCRIKIEKNSDSTVETIIEQGLKRENRKKESGTTERKITIEKRDFEILTESLLKSITSFLIDKKDAVQFVNSIKKNSKEHYASIIVTPQERYVDFSALSAMGYLDGLRGTQKQQNYISRIRGARLLAKWLTLEGRRGDLEEWNAAFNPATGRIHGSFNGIGAWTHRMSHVRPNKGNIFSNFTVDQCKSDPPSGVEEVKLKYNGVLRSLWQAAPGRLLVGTDAEGIQMRVLAHYINDPEFTEAIVNGRKEDGTDVHSFNRRLLGEICRSRADAKTFIYAWLLGAGVGKIAEILGCGYVEARASMDNFVRSMPGLDELKRFRIPSDARRGYFVGLDGRKVICKSERLVITGYLQNGEACVMKHANRLWREWADKEGLNYKQIDFVHDEWVSEVETEEEGNRLGRLQADSIRLIGEELKLNCELAGEYKLGSNWLQVH